MTRQFDIDRVLEDWFAEGPSQFPERAAWETIERLGNIQQRRSSRLPGSQRMHRLMLSAAAVAAAVIAVVVAIGSPDRNPQVGAPSGIAFVSERHGYTVTLPQNLWRREERSGAWALGEFFDANTPSGVDYFEALDETPTRAPTLYVYLASQAIPGGMTFDEWAASHDAATDREQPCFGLLGNYERRRVAGEMARIGTHRCDDFDGEGNAWVTVQTLVAHNGRGYAIYVWPIQQGLGMPPIRDIQTAATDWLARFSFND